MRRQSRFMITSPGLRYHWGGGRDEGASDFVSPSQQGRGPESPSWRAFTNPSKHLQPFSLLSTPARYQWLWQEEKEAGICRQRPTFTLHTPMSISNREPIIQHILPNSTWRLLSFDFVRLAADKDGLDFFILPPPPKFWYSRCAAPHLLCSNRVSLCI